MLFKETSDVVKFLSKSTYPKNNFVMELNNMVIIAQKNTQCFLLMEKILLSFISITKFISMTEAFLG